METSKGHSTIQSPASRGRKPELLALTGLRFVAAFFVVIHHYARPILAGMPEAIRNIADSPTAVGTFFLLSGFVLSYRYLTPDGAFRGSTRAFLVARIARIYPVYFIAFLLAAPFVIGGSLRVNDPAIAAMKLSVNATLALLLQQSWTPYSAWYWNTPGWSLSTELFFYLTFPMVAVWMGRRSRSQLIPVLALSSLAAIAAPAWYSATHPVVQHPPFSALQTAIEVMPPFRWPEFLMGVALGRLYVTRPGGSRYGAIYSGAGAALLLFGLSLSSSLPRPILSNGLLAPAGALLIYGLALEGSILSRILSTPLLVQLGTASYSLYILQLPLAHVFGIQSGTASLLRFAVFSAVLITISILSLRFVEDPARKAILSRFKKPHAAEPVIPQQAGLVAP